MKPNKTISLIISNVGVHYSSTQPTFQIVRHKKTTRGWSFMFGGGGGNRTRVRRSSAFGSTCLFHLL